MNRLLPLFFMMPMSILAEGTAPALHQYSPSAWSPYVAGAGIGILLCLTLYFSKTAIGASSAYATGAGLIGKQLAPQHTQRMKYYQDNPPRADWGLIFVIATIFGAFFAAWDGQELANRWVPELWADHFGGAAFVTRSLAALGGGFLMAFGARMAKGCTSGHGISGAAQLNVGSWIALFCFFAGGAVVANLMYRT